MTITPAMSVRIVFLVLWAFSALPFASIAAMTAGESLLYFALIGGLALLLTVVLVYLPWTIRITADDASVAGRNFRFRRVDRADLAKVRVVRGTTMAFRPSVSLEFVAADGRIRLRQPASLYSRADIRRLAEFLGLPLEAPWREGPDPA